MNTKELTKGQMAALAVTAVPMVAVGAAGGYATYTNMLDVFGSGPTALGVVAAGEGATVIASLVALTRTLLGQSVPAVARWAMWLLPVVAAVTGIVVARDASHAVVMAMTPLALTVSGEGLAYVARSVVAYTSGVDVDTRRNAQRYAWHQAGAVKDGRGAWWSKRQLRHIGSELAGLDDVTAARVIDVQRDHLVAVLTSGVPVATAVDAAPSTKPVSVLVTPAEAPALGAAEATTLAPAEAVTEAPAPKPAEAVTEAVLISAEAPSAVLAEAHADCCNSQLLTAAEVAALKGVNTKAVSNRVDRKQLTVAGKNARGRRLFCLADVDALTWP